MMKTKILSVFSFVVFALLTAQSALATPGCPPGVPACSGSVPEIDAAAGVSAIALLAGVVALMVDRRKRSQSGSKH